VANENYGAMVVLSGHYARNPVLPTPRSCMEQPSLFPPFARPSTQAAAQAQDHIGLINLLLGQLATEWSNLQH